MRKPFIVILSLLSIISINLFIYYKQQQPVTDLYKENFTNDIVSKYRSSIYIELKSSLTSDNFNILLDELKEKLNVNDDDLVSELKNMTLSNKDDVLVDRFLDILTIHEKDELVSMLSSKLSSNINEKAEAKENGKATASNNKIDRKRYFKNILNLLTSHAPESKSLTKEEQGSDVGGNFFTRVHNQFTIDYLRRVNLTPQTFKDLQLKHDNLVSNLLELEYPEKKIPNKPNRNRGLTRGFKNKKAPVNKSNDIFSGDGIVINGGGVYFGSALVLVRQLRELGSKYPIELIIDTMAEYDSFICTNLLPKMNARCLVIEEEIGESTLKSLGLAKFELKVIGILISSFENCLVLDADNIPIKNPDYLFESDLYKKTNWLLWPDIWHRGTSPLYYNIARLRIGEPVRRDMLINSDLNMKSRDDMALHDLDGVPPSKTVESGQMLFNKKAHYKSFLLSVYYNIYGFSHYYRLLFQGTNGEGDKETFLPALYVFDESYHLCDYISWLAGYIEPVSNFFQETTIVQYDPVGADEFLSRYREWLQRHGVDSRISIFQDNDYTKNLLNQYLEETKDDARVKEPDVQFLHFHRPKINPLINHSDQYQTYTRRNLGPCGKHSDRWTNDWELRVHTISKWVACEAIDDAEFWVKMGLNQQDVCEAVSGYVDMLMEDTNDADMAVLKKLW